MEWQTFGHKTVKTLLEKQLEADAFSHAYMFLGPEGIGKRTLAQELAVRIRQTQHVTMDPDISTVTVTPEFGVEEMRHILESVRLRPMSGTRKAVILDNAQLLNTQSANALLKTLEEPTSSTIIFLISTNRSLPKTILSRCQVFAFNRFTLADMESFVEREALSVQPDAMRLANGSVAWLRKIIEDPGFLTQLKEHEQTLRQLIASNVAGRMLAVQTLSAKSAQELETIFAVWGKTMLSWGVRTEARVRWLSLLVEARTQLTTTINTKFILEGLLINLPRNI